MRRALFALLLLVVVPAWADEQPKDLSWQEMIPPDAPPEIPNMKPLHDLSNMADALSVEAAPAAKQELPNAPVVQSLNGMHIRLPGYIVPLTLPPHLIATPPPSPEKAVPVLAPAPKKGDFGGEVLRTQRELSAGTLAGAPREESPVLKVAYRSMGRHHAACMKLCRQRRVRGGHRAESTPLGRMKQS